jgi:hypothetical protein
VTKNQFMQPTLRAAAELWAPAPDLPIRAV